MDQAQEQPNHSVTQEQDGQEYSCFEEYFLDLCRQGDLKEVQECLQDPEVDITWFDNNLNTCIHMASANGHLEILKELLAVTKEGKPVLDINARNADGCTALHWAVINKQKSVIEYLIEKGIDCSIPNKFGRTPLDEAIESESFELGEILAKHTKPTEEELKEPEGEDAIDEDKGDADDEDENDTKEEKKE